MEDYLSSPEIIMDSIRITEFGDLPKGLYFYCVKCVSQNVELTSQIVQVYAKYDSNSVLINWKEIAGVKEYKVYRGRDMFDGYFTVYEPYFHDNGFGELNIK